MGYIPGLDNDVFISYSHLDDSSGWVTRFHDEFKIQLEDILGPVSIWRDAKLQGAEDFNQTIQNALASTGVLLTVVSPNFLSSKYCCEREFPHFQRNLDPPGLPIGSRFRVVKAIRRPADADRHRHFVPGALGFDFWKEDTQSGTIEELGTKAFRDKVSRLAQAVAQILTDLRNLRLPLYVAKPSSDLDTEFEDLRTELHARGYRILPSTRIWTEQAIADELKTAALSIHLFGSQFDEFVIKQASLSRERELPLLAWLGPNTRDTYGTAVEELEGYTNLVALVDQTPAWKLPGMIDQCVRPKPSAHAAPASAKLRVFILCEPRQEREWHFAIELRDKISTSEDCDVDVPDRSASNMWADRIDKLRSADGVLVYWDTTDERWLTYAHEDLREMAVRRRRDYKSEALVVSDPQRIPPVVSQLVVGRKDPFDVGQLRPFFERLRQPNGAAAP